MTADQVFLIAVDGAEAAESLEFTQRAIIKSRWKLGWWHWMGSLWIVVAPAQVTNAAYWRDTAMAFMPSATVLVLELPTIPDWAGFVPQEALDWMRSIGAKDLARSRGDLP